MSKALFLMIFILSLLLVAALITFNVAPAARVNNEGPTEFFQEMPLIGLGGRETMPMTRLLIETLCTQRNC